MPYHRNWQPPREVAGNHEWLVSSIAEELNPQETMNQRIARESTADRPDIYERTIRNTDRVRVYVVWAKWSGVREDYRTAAILDAYERALGTDAAQRVIVALGVMPEEAKELGIHD